MVELLTNAVTSLPPWLRMVVAIAFIVGGGFVVWFISFRLGALMLVVGTIFILFSEKSDSERNGYHF